MQAFRGHVRIISAIDYLFVYAVLKNRMKWFRSTINVLTRNICPTKSGKPNKLNAGVVKVSKGFSFYLIVLYFFII